MITRGKRTALVFLAILAIASTHAQGLQYLYGVEVGGVYSQADVKVVTELINVHNGILKVSCSDNLHLFKVLSSQSIDVDNLNDQLIDHGFQLNNIAISLPTNANSTKSIPGFPQLQKTGDPIQDAQDYHIAKTQWVQDHPELYQQLISPTSSPDLPE